jgi:hypothetical protein
MGQKSVKETAGSNNRMPGNRLARAGVGEGDKGRQGGKLVTRRMAQHCLLHRTLVQGGPRQQETMG